MLRRVFVIINPATGTESPVLAVVNQALRQAQIKAEFGITQQAGDAREFAQQALRRRFDAVVVCGGDGTVMEAAQALVHKTLPLIIIPTGTANIMARELTIPLDLLTATQVLTKRPLKKRMVDVAICNGQYFMLRVNIGLPAEMVKNTRRRDKNKFGRLAYVASGLKQLKTEEKARYRLHFGTHVLEVAGRGLLIINAGNTGLSSISFHPKINISDGLLNVLLLSDITIMSWLAYVRALLTSSPLPPEVKHWSTKSVTVEVLQPQAIMVDDRSIADRVLKISILSRALSILT